MNNATKIIISGLVLVALAMFVLLALILIGRNNSQGSLVNGGLARYSYTTVSSASANSEDKVIDSVVDDANKAIDNTLSDLPIVDSQADFGI